MYLFPGHSPTRVSDEHVSVLSSLTSIHFPPAFSHLFSWCFYDACMCSKVRCRHSFMRYLMQSVANVFYSVCSFGDSYVSKSTSTCLCDNASKLLPMAFSNSGPFTISNISLGLKFSLNTSMLFCTNETALLSWCTVVNCASNSRTSICVLIDMHSDVHSSKSKHTPKTLCRGLASSFFQYDRKISLAVTDLWILG